MDVKSLSASEFVEIHFKDYVHKEAILEALREQNYSNELLSENCSKSNFLEQAFYWNKTKEGFNFWKDEFEKFVGQ